VEIVTTAVIIAAFTVGVVAFGEGYRSLFDPEAIAIPMSFWKIAAIALGVVALLFIGAALAIANALGREFDDMHQQHDQGGSD